MNDFINISTLGPNGTDSERAAKYFAQIRRLPPYDLKLSSSFEKALQDVREGGAHFGIVPAAYNDLLGLHYRFRDLLIDELFLLPTKEMVLARRSGTEVIRCVALHPSTDSFAPEGVEKLYIPSKPLCIEAVIRGDADACIGSRDVADKYGLEVVESYGEIPMSWEVFRRG
ncbi:MAG: hypothetical protein HYS80_02185 [Candidatus Aenigmarchaeota archaeon]|nr:hypothetical protein [Candidatus Aenigmarchaeota archaeon]